jgi:hypothetical protein
MDEMQLLRELREGTSLVSAAELVPARERLLAATRPRRRFGRRIALSGAAVIGLAAAIFGVFALIPPSPSGSGPVPAASAEVVLRSAATAALNEPFTEPRPDQFVYKKYQSSTGQVREVWLSVDGTRNGLIHVTGTEDEVIGGCKPGDGEVYVHDGKRIVQPCQPHPGFVAAMPATVDDVLAYLRKNHSGDDGDINAMGKDILDYMDSYLRPAARAALYGAVSRIEGLHVDPGAKDAAGRAAIKISWTAPRNRSGEFLINPRTYVFVGYGTFEAALTMAIVDKVGQRP